MRIRLQGIGRFIEHRLVNLADEGLVEIEMHPAQDDLFRRRRWRRRRWRRRWRWWRRWRRFRRSTRQATEDAADQRATHDADRDADLVSLRGTMSGRSRSDGANSTACDGTDSRSNQAGFLPLRSH